MLLLIRYRTLNSPDAFFSKSGVRGSGGKLPGRRGEFGSLLSRGCTRPKGTVYTLVYLGKPKGNALSNMLKFIKPLERKTGSG